MKKQLMGLIGADYVDFVKTEVFDKQRSLNPLVSRYVGL
jgi:hypothetical protein